MICKKRVVLLRQWSRTSKSERAFSNAFVSPTSSTSSPTSNVVVGSGEYVTAPLRTTAITVAPVDFRRLSDAGLPFAAFASVSTTTVCRRTRSPNGASASPMRLVIERSRVRNIP